MITAARDSGTMGYLHPWHEVSEEDRSEIDKTSDYREDGTVNTNR